MAHIPYKHGPLLLKLIAVSKLLKGTALLILGFHLLRLLRPDAHELLRQWVEELRLDPHNHYIHSFIEKLTGISRPQLQLLSVGSFIYGVLYLTESVGLFLDALWAEWLTVITTAGFIPVEIYEIFHHLSWIKIAVFLFNVLILVYLIRRLKQRHAEAKRHRAPAFPSAPTVPPP